MNSKATIREKYIAIREELSEERRLQASLAATKQLLKLLSGFGQIISFASKDEEINLWPLNKQLATEGRLLLPRMVSGSEIVPFQVKNLDQELVLHPKWNVLEPNPKLCKEVIVEKIDFAIVPGVAFDRGHGRLGYGKGFYDRFLSKLSCPLIGVGFKEQLLEPPFPHEKHDVPLTDIYLF
ncbi:MAG: 5-formyltetrahydrofolate cyclo-ligase [Chlamydiales bacterium]|nr:5-formyltetrahydrofolate cyclo-ligase [Chlamydiia bacterium]MCP5503976.1 5-formyltetrahydrofolate cyclo-ligase [Chlamydiales bacterium]